MNRHIVSREEARRRGDLTYFTGRPCKHGHISPRYVAHKTCLDCNVMKSRKHCAKFREKVNAQRRAYARSHPRNILLNCAKIRAKAWGLPFNLTLDDIVIPDRCPVLGIPIIVGVGKTNPSSPTLDRTIPDKGYVRGNVAVISHRANTIKQNATPKELRAIARWLERRIREQEPQHKEVRPGAAQLRLVS